MAREKLVKPKNPHLQIVLGDMPLSPEHTSRLGYLGVDDKWCDLELHLPQLLAWAFYMDRALESLDDKSIRALPVQGFQDNREAYEKWLRKKFSCKCCE